MGKTDKMTLGKMYSSSGLFSPLVNPVIYQLDRTLGRAQLIKIALLLLYTRLLKFSRELELLENCPHFVFVGQNHLGWDRLTQFNNSR